MKFKKHALAFFILSSGFFTLGAIAYSAISTPPAPSYAVYPPVINEKGYAPDLIKQGEYLTKAGDCIACHTNTTVPGSPSFAGGLPFKTPFGNYYSPNITPDPKTGIGTWTDAQFIQAMRHGKAPDGSNYFPVFPYNSFNYVTENDLKAIKAYLMSIPAVQQKNKEPDAPWPFNWRFAQLGWKILFQNNKGPYVSDPKHTPEWNRGAYLAEGLAHCGECHTPRNFLGAVKQKYALTGAIVDGYFAANISGPGLKNYSIADLLNVFIKGEKLGGHGKVGGPMAEVNAVSLKYLSPADLRAIAVYIKTVNSVQPEVNTSNGPVSEDDAKELYEEHCSVCHNVGSGGAPKITDGAAWAARLTQQGQEGLYKNAINGINSMPAMGACLTCSQNDIKAIVDYLIKASKAKEGNASAAASGPKVLTLNDGKKVYEQHCAVCHNPNTSSKDIAVTSAPKLGNQDEWKIIMQKNMDVLVWHTFQGYRAMPAKGGCISCTMADLKAATKYMAQQGQKNKDYSLW